VLEVGNMATPEHETARQGRKRARPNVIAAKAGIRPRFKELQATAMLRRDARLFRAAGYQAR